ncbi:hypothetical protein O6H91_Y142800 [Diphasiastrum complanatum]|nr:hypothetical protein O6H91_Y142800 [Diphasiastrum complanatum]
MSNIAQNMGGVAPNYAAQPPSFDGVAPNLESQYQDKAYYVNSRANSSRGRCWRVADLVLRILAAALSLIAFATVASDSKSATEIDGLGGVFQVNIKYSNFGTMKAVLAANVLVCAYSLAQTLGALVSIVAGHGLLPTPLSEYLSFSFDQFFAYLVLATSAAGAETVHLVNNGFGSVWQSLCKNTGLSGFCTIAAASVSMSFLTFVVVGMSAIESGYFLAKYISRS